jgi:hypothetical protein
MNTQNKKILASILFLLISFVCMAQKAPPPPQTLLPPPPVGLPIDGGVLLGACFAVYYGAKKLLDNK